MRIGVDVSIANQDKKTGVAWYSYYLIEAIKKLEAGNNDHQYFLYTDQPLKGELAKLPANFKEIYLPWNHRFGWAQFALSKELKNNPPDVLFVPGRILPRNTPLRTITTIHDVGFLEYPEYYSLTDRLKQLFALKRAIKKSSQIITVSNYTKDKLLELSKTLAEVVPLAHDPNIYFVDNDTTAIQQTLDKYKIGKQFLFFVGRLDAKKNIDRLVRSFLIIKKEFPDLQLVLAGNPSFGWDEVQKYIQQSGEGESIKILNWLPPQEIRHLYNRAVALLFPSLYEGFGLPVLEAQACGCPVITSNITSLPEVANSSCVLVNPLEVGDIARGIKALLITSDLRQVNIEAGFKNIQRYSWEKTAKETLEILMK